MSYVTAQTDVMAAAAANFAEIRSAVNAASAAAAAPTTGLLAAAADEVSTAWAGLFSTYANEYQAAINQLGVLQEEFSKTVAGAALAYAQTEIANAAATAAGTLRSILGGSVAASAASAAAPLLQPLMQIMSDPNTTFTVIMGASGYPIPAPEYIDDLAALYIFPWQTIGNNLQGLVTPEGLYPMTGVKDLTLDVSVQRGLTILDDAIRPLATLGNTVNILGYSQSSVISSLEMALLNPTNTLGGSILPGDISFTMLGNPANPNGGLLARFPGLALPSLGITFGTATPDNSFPSRIYTVEYDGFGGFPQYPINLLSDLNAFMGILTLHGTYPFMTDTQIANAIQLTNTLGPVQTEYFMLPTENLPLLAPVRAIPVIGHPLAALLEPNLEVLVNLGYGNTEHGWSPDPPNVPTGFGVIPPVPPGEIFAALAAGTQQGISDFTTSINTEVVPHFANLPTTLPAQASTTLGQIGTGGTKVLAGLQHTLSSPSNFIESLLDGFLKVSYTSSNIAATAYATVLPTTDIVNATLTAIPAYNVYLFANGLLQAVNGDPVGGLINAFGGPIAADVGLGTLLVGFELRVIQHAVQSIIADLQALGVG